MNPPAYLLQETPIEYTIIDELGNETVSQHRDHHFAKTGQRYERIANGVCFHTKILFTGPPLTSSMQKKCGTMLLN